MKRFLTAVALTCVLSGSALAGDIPTCGITSEDSTTTETTTPGHIPSTDYAESDFVAVLLNILCVL
jgi:hypothetical protein